ncbi:MAG: CotH kinase family protein [Bacteroidales bacterium]|nr:CotH kinase family protein [Bacteroidales bacterium]
MPNKPLFIILAFVTLLFKLIAQPAFPEPGPLYVSNTVPRIDIVIHPDSLAWIYENVESNHEFRATFVFNNGDIHDTINDIGFRLRGNTSRHSQKKSLKVSFNTFISGRKYHGVEKLNLNGEHNDPSVIRARLVWDIFNQSKVAVPRSNHVRVYINGNYYGLYINVEHIDENFVKSRFGNNDGDLYKCLWPADLDYLGSNPNLYKLEHSGRRVYDLKIQENDDYTLIAEFINTLNNTTISQLPCELEKIFNVQDYLKIAALDILTANWDGYIFNKNNFYLYFNTDTGLFEYIPYDVDNSFGIDWFNVNWSTRNIYSWNPSSSSEKRALYSRIMQVPEYKAQFTYYLKQAVNHVTATQTFIDSVNSIKDLISPYLVYDPYYPLDYGYNMNSFNNSYYQALGDHVPIGLFPFFTNRNASALAQASNINAPPMIKYIRHNHPRPGQQVLINAFVEDEDENPLVEVEYRVNGNAWSQVTMSDDGQQNDGLAGDKTFGVYLDAFPANTMLEFRISAGDSQQSSSLKPCDPVFWLIAHPSGVSLYINEFMASNSTTIADEFGEYDDWIEIFNAGSEPVWLGDKYLSDNLNNPTKWAFPDTTISAGGFLIVWADGQPEQGPMHTPYKLDKDGEEIGLFDNEVSNYALIDSYVYGSQETDISMGRNGDGAGEWVFFTTPTPGSSNGVSGIQNPESPIKPLNFWPNPVTGNFIYFDEAVDFQIFNLQGLMLMQAEKVQNADITDLPAGIYLVKALEHSAVKLVILRR